MSVCPNINSAEWKALENAVGRFEAMKDWMENDQTIRDPKDVQEKIATRNAKPIALRVRDKETFITRRLLNSKTIKRKNNILFVLQHKYPEALKVASEVNADYGLGTVRILPVTTTTGRGGRTIYKVEVNEPETTETLEEQLKDDPNQTTMFVRDWEPIDLDLASVNNTAAREMAGKISAALKVPYEIIDKTQALAIEPNWKNEIGFFKNNIAYFVGDNLRTDIVFHEFAHPFVRSLMRDNPKLANTLYKKLVVTPEGIDILQNKMPLYTDLSEGSDAYKEEVLVRALTRSAIDQLKDTKPSTGFAKFIKDLLYALKQLARQVFGKTIKIETLKPNTSLQELADILVKGNKIQLDVKPVSQADITAYAKHTREELKELVEGTKGIKDNPMVKMVNLQSSHTFKWFKKLQDGKYVAPAKALGITGNELEQIIELLSNYRSTKNQEQFRKKLKLLEEKVGRRDQQAAAFVNSLLLVQKSGEKIEKHLKTLAKDVDNKDNISQMIYYKHYIDDWILNSDNMIRTLSKEGVSPLNPLYKLVVSNKSLFENNLRYLSDTFAKNTFSVMQNVLDVLKTNVDEYYNNKKAQMIKSGASASSIAQLEKDHNKDRLTDKKYWDIIKGSGTDANRFNSFMEGYMNNQDPAVLSLAGYIQRGIHDYLSAIQGKANDIKLKLLPLLQNAKWNRARISSLAEKITFEDTMWVKNPDTGKMEQKPMLVYLNEFKGAKNDEIEKILAIEDLEEAAKKRDDPPEADSWKEIREKREELAKWRTDYMHQEKKPEFYARYAIFSNTDIRRKAKEEMDDFYEERNIYEKKAFEEGFSNFEDDKLWKNYQQRERQLFNEFYPDGTMKEGEELEMVKIRKEYRAASRDMYEYILKPGAFENAREQKVQELEALGISEANPMTKDEFETTMDQWDRRNTQKRLKKDPAEEIRAITNRLRELNAKMSAEYKAKADLTIPYDKISDIEKQHKDIDYQTDASQMSPGERDILRKNQEDINRLKKAFSSKTRLDLTDMEAIEYKHLNKLLLELRSKYASDYYLDAFNSFLENRNGEQVDTSLLREITGDSEITRDTADRAISDRIVNNLMEQSPEFEKWFKANHVRVERYEEVEGARGMVEKWERLWAWNVTELNDPDAYEKIEIKNDEGKVVKVIQGAPSIRYYRRVVRPEFLTGYDSETGEVNLVEGLHIDNRGNWLPLRMEHGAKDARYRNEAYYKLKDSENYEDQQTFKLLEGIKEQSLEIQKGLDNANKLWYEHPRFSMNNLEILQSKGMSKGVTSAWKEFVSVFQKKEDDQEYGYNANVTDGIEETITNVQDDEQVTMLSNNMDLKQAQVGGTYKIDIDRVSRDIPAALLKYMAHAERNKKFKEMLPTATAFQLVFSDPERAKRELEGVNKRNWLNRSFTDPNDKTARAAAIDFLVNREFRGQMLSGPFADNKGFNSIINLMFGRASMSFFALNIPGALQNQFGPIFQGITESFSGKYWNQASLGRGIAWSFKTMSQLSIELNNPGVKSLDVQKVEIFDMGAGNFEKSVGESMTRTLGKDAASLSWFMSFRKWTETQATVSLGGATLDYIMLTQNMPDGTTRQVKYLDAWELDAKGKIKLLDGINPEFAHVPINHTTVEGDTVSKLAKQYHTTEARIKKLNDLKTDQVPVGKEIKIANAEEFSKTRSTLHEVSRRNQGAYSTFELAQLNSNTLGRVVMFMKKFFIPMFMDRWAFKGNIVNPRPRYNLATGELTQGYYITVLSHIMQAVKNLNLKLLYTPSEVDKGMAKRAYVKLITEVSMLIGMTLLWQALFDWDPTDKDRYAKRRKKSGPLPTPFTVDDPKHPFHLDGWLANHALSLMMRIKNENEQLLPVPGLGLDNYANMLSMRSYVMGPTVDAFVNVATDVTKMSLGDKSAFYKKDVGTYTWNQAEMPKILQHTAIALGFTNKDIEPLLKIKAIEDFQRGAGGKR